VSSYLPGGTAGQQQVQTSPITAEAYGEDKGVLAKVKDTVKGVIGWNGEEAPRRKMDNASNYLSTDSDISMPKDQLSSGARAYGGSDVGADQGLVANVRDKLNLEPEGQQLPASTAPVTGI
jgi:hypothetical protein